MCTEPKRIWRQENVEKFSKRFDWTERFASEFLVEFRNCGSFYNAYNQALQSVYVNPNQKPEPDANPFRKGL